MALDILIIDDEADIRMLIAGVLGIMAANKARNPVSV